MFSTLLITSLKNFLPEPELSIFIEWLNENKTWLMIKGLASNYSPKASNNSHFPSWFFFNGSDQKSTNIFFR